MADNMGLSNVWRARLDRVATKLLFLVWVVMVYLASEVMMWALSRALAPVSLEFFASILGMVLVFAVMTVTQLSYRDADNGYARWIKSKVDFINAHLGLGFPIPIVMLDQSKTLNGHDIGCVIGNFVVTNAVSWTVVFALALMALAGPMIFTSRVWTRGSAVPEPSLSRPYPATPPRIEISWHSDSTLIPRSDTLELGTSNDNPKRLSEPEQTPLTSRRSSMQSSSQSSGERSGSPWWRWLAETYPISLSLIGAFAIGAPLAASTGDERILDGCVLWFIWITSVILQRLFRRSRLLPSSARLKSVLATLLNPVLATTLLMTAYTRLKATAAPGADFGEVLKKFSSGTPLYSLWTAGASGTTPPNNPTSYFGAGDAALSILECGMLIWGFKLYECRRQLFSAAGLLTALISVAAAAGNVFLSAMLGHAMGLERPEALAFAARSTTLALAKPAMVAAGGNPAVNAALVVSNGILGQLLYPFVLDKLGVRREMDPTRTTSVRSSASRGRGEEHREMLRLGQENQAAGFKEAGTRPSSHGGGYEEDGPLTAAAGIAVGINGAAMGVAYLYETRSRAAPYAALAMTVSGVMTVVFTTVEPFKSAVVGLAGG